MLRADGGRVQETAHRTIQTLKMPGTAKAFIALMMMAMMLRLFTVVVHVVLAGQAAAAATGDRAANAAVQVWATWLEALRRLGAATYLLSIALGLVTIFKVLGFQAIRIWELAAEPRRERSAKGRMGPWTTFW